MRWISGVVLVLVTRAFAVTLPCPAVCGVHCPDSQVMTGVDVTCQPVCLPTTTTSSSSSTSSSTSTSSTSTTTTSTTTTSTTSTSTTSTTSTTLAPSVIAHEMPADVIPGSPSAFDFECNGGTDPMSWLNQGGASFTQVNPYCNIHAPASATDNIRGREETGPVAPYSWRGRLTCNYKIANAVFCGLYVRNSTNGHLLTLGNGNTGANSAPNTICFTYTSATAANASACTAYISTEEYFRIDIDATNFTLFASSDGLSWHQIVQTALAGFMTSGGGTVDKLGFFANSINSGTAVDANVYWVREQ